MSTLESTLAAFAASTLPTAQANTSAAVTVEINDLNNNLKSIYLTSFNNWLLSWLDGRNTDITTAPQPPNGYVLGTFIDPTTGAGIPPYGVPVIWAYPQVGTVPVTPMPAIPAMPPPMPPPTAFSGSGTVMNLPHGDMTPVGNLLTLTDGSKWVKVATPTPFGMEYYYQRQS